MRTTAYVQPYVDEGYFTVQHLGDDDSRLLLAGLLTMDQIRELCPGAKIVDSAPPVSRWKEDDNSVPIGVPD